MKIKNRVKFFVMITISVMSLILIVSLIFNTASSFKEHEYKIIHVSEGETLWSIAQNIKNNNEYYKSKDIREIVYKITTYNNLSKSSLYVGQKLKI